MRVSSAMSPMLWLSGIVTPSCLTYSLFATFPFNIAGFALAAAPVIVAIMSYRYFKVNDPDRLHSEDFQIRSRALTMIEGKDDTSPTSNSSIDAIANPRKLSTNDKEPRS